MPVILCYGDSNTHGSLPMRDMEDRRRLGPGERWPGVMARTLGPDWEVVAEGLPARTITVEDPVDGAHKSGLLVLPAILESHRPIDVVALMLGTNDLKARFAFQPIDIAAAVDRLVGAILASDAGPDWTAPKILLIAPPPVMEAGCLAEMFAGGEAKAAGYGPLYRGVAGRRGIGFLDAGSVISVSPLDGVHFEAEAHGALGRAVAKAVAAL